MIKQLLVCSVGFATIAQAQVSDMVSLGAGYTNESYYSFQNGEVANVDNYNWDLSFDLSSWGAAVRLNRKNATLYTYSGSTADWSTLDTTGLATWEQPMNGFDYWEEGAVSNAADPQNPFDLGWGEYNPTTHQIIGSRIFVLEFTSGEYKKFMVESLISGAYAIRMADLNGANEVADTITKTNYSGKNFVYYDVLNDSIIDREPLSADWDVVFTNYLQELAPGYIGGLTSVLHNYNTVVSEVSGVPTANATAGVYDTTIATIGSDWKSFSMSTFTYEIVDSLCYFVKTQNEDVWKLVFTGFDGSSTGNIYFTKEQVEFAGIVEEMGANLVVYPNPANNEINVNFPHEIAEMNLVNISGRVVASQVSNLSQLNVSNLPSGVYFLNVIDTEGRVATQKINIQH